MLTHGKSKIPEYQAWSDMIKRCESPKRTDWKHYGGRGITVCPRWRASFAAFYADMGERPNSNYSLDRYPDNNGNYEPGNCRWATRSEQQDNKRQTLTYKISGVRRSLNEWSAIYGINPLVVYTRMRRGMSAKQALQTPVRLQYQHSFIARQYSKTLH